MISFHYHLPKASTNFATYKYGWTPFNRIQLDEIAGMINRKVWSPIQWDLGRRGSENFKCAQVIALDFDEGYTIEEAQAYCEKKGWAYIIGTTKSHMIHKGTKPPCHRFRLLLFWDKPIKNADSYEYNLGLILKQLPQADKKCKDLARLFFPCKQLWAYKTGGFVEVKARPSSYMTKKKRIEKHDKNLSKYKGKSILPKNVVKKINSHIEEGERNNTLYSVSCDLFKIGWTPDRIYDYVIENPAIKSLGDKEIFNTIDSAAKSKT